MDQTIQVLDLKRMFIGDLPWTFTLEVAVRTLFMYLFALILIRLLGKRGMGQLSPFEFVIIIALGSAVGDPMFYPEVPLLHGMVVLSVVVLMERSLVFFVHRSETVESFIEGAPRGLVIDGRLDLEGMQIESISREEMFAVLREAGVEQLGEVKRAYLEQSGKISTFLFPPKERRPGLPLVPPWDIQKPDTLIAGTATPHAGYHACANCGAPIYLGAGATLTACVYCQASEWIPVSDTPALDK